MISHISRIKIHEIYPIESSWYVSIRSEAPIDGSDLISIDLLRQEILDTIEKSSAEGLIAHPVKIMCKD